MDTMEELRRHTKRVTGSRPRRLVIGGLGVLAALAAWVPPALADDDTGEEIAVDRAREATPTTSPAARFSRARRFDYSRFRDGPRRVPRARGASLARAKGLGLGTRETATRLLRGKPAERWVAAANWRPSAPRRASTKSQPAPLLWPVAAGRFGRGFGFVRTTRPDKRHNGVDIVAREGEVVRAVADGIVGYSDNGVRGFGNCILIVHPDASVSVYAHNYRNTVQAGWRVRRGERIGFVGTTGISRGPHLHFELRHRGTPVDPLKRFSGRPWIRAYRTWQAQLRRGTLPPLRDHLGSTHLGSTEKAATKHPSAPATTADPTVPQRARVAALRLIRRGIPEPQRERLPGRNFSTLLWPLRGGEGVARSGRGVNIAAPEGTPVRAAADGRVVFAGAGLPGLGIAVVLAHPNGWVTVYGALREIGVSVGQDTLRGEWIGRSGPAFAKSAGKQSSAGAPHLHFQLRQDGRARDPRALFAQQPHTLGADIHEPVR